MRIWAVIALLAVASLSCAGHAFSAAAASPKWNRWNYKNEAPRTYRIDGLTLTTSVEPTSHGRRPVLTIATGRMPAVRVVGSESPPFSATGEFVVLRLEATQREPAVMFRSFTGGAHCCLAYQVIRPASVGWKVDQLGKWDDSAAPNPIDVDRDGRLEFLGRDQRFQYAFTSYAESVPPARVYQLVDGELVDASSLPQYRRQFASEFTNLRAHCEKGRGRGYCASFAATAARLGRVREAWPVLDRAVPPDSEPDSAPWIGRGPTDAPRKAFPSFREAVAWYLTELGYLSGPAPLGAHQ